MWEIAPKYDPERSTRTICSGGFIYRIGDIVESLAHRIELVQLFVRGTNHLDLCDERELHVQVLDS